MHSRSSPTKAVPRSKDSVTIVTRQPSFSSPTRFVTGMRTSFRKSWANSVVPSMVRSGWISIPGESMGMISHEMPRLRSSPVRTSSSQKSATSACDVQIFEPVTT